MTTELYKKYRPSTLDEVRGQDKAVRVLRAKLAEKKFPHTTILAGPSGVGKTTLVRAVKEELGCHDNDFHDMNAAESRGIDTVRDIQKKIKLSPWSGRCCVWLLDEAHALTRQGQDALLKTLEDTPRHVFFFLATTEPDQLIRTIRTRSMEVTLDPIGDDVLLEILKEVCEKEGAEVGEPVLVHIAANAGGSARQALMRLEEVVALEDDEARMLHLDDPQVKAEADQLCRALLDERSKWPDIKSILSRLKEDPEKIRWRVMGYARAALLRKWNPRALLVLKKFQYPYHHTGANGLTLNCGEIFE